MGVDGLYEDRNGDHVAYQVKFHSDSQTVPYGNFATFIATSEAMNGRVVFTNERDIGGFAKLRRDVRTVRGHDFDAPTAEELSEISEWLKTGLVRPTPRNPLPHRGEALDQIIATAITNAVDQSIIGTSIKVPQLALPPPLWRPAAMRIENDADRHHRPQECQLHCRI